MTEKHLLHIERRAREAMPEPWYSHEGILTCGNLVHGIGEHHLALFNDGESKFMFSPEDVCNSHFVARARSDVPDMIAEIRRCWTRIEELERLVKEQVPFRAD